MNFVSKKFKYNGKLLLKLSFVASTEFPPTQNLTVATTVY